MRAFYIKVGDAVLEAGIRLHRFEMVYDDGGVNKVLVEYDRPDGERRSATVQPNTTDGLDLMSPSDLE